MSKRIKCTLAILLVVCALFGLVAVPAVATDGESTAATPKTFTYDFTVLSNKDGEYKVDAEHVAWHSNGTKLYGFGGVTTNDYIWDATGASVVDAFYNEGKIAVGEDEIAIDLNWAFAAEGQVADRESRGSLIFGGYNYNNESQIAAGNIDTKKAQYFNGIEYTPKYVNTSGTTKKSATGWVAIKIKAPEVGTYAVSLDYTKSQYGARRASAYILPGVVTDAEVIRAAIANEEGKLESNICFWEDRANLVSGKEIRDDIIYGRPITEDSTKITSNVGQYGHKLELGIVDIEEPVDEYTVIFVAEKSRENETVEVNEGTDYPAQMALDGLTFTLLSEEYADSSNSRKYEFGVYNNNITDVKTAWTTTGTADSTEGGYAFVTAGVSGNSITYGETVINNKAVSANWNVLRYKNTATSTVYWVKDYDRVNKTAVMEDENYQINYNLKRTLDSLYNKMGWQYIGSSVANNGIIFNNQYIQVYSISNSNYVAFKLKSPGEGTYEIDLNVYHPSSVADLNDRHMSMLFYIMEADDAVYTVDDGMKVNATLPATPNATYLTDFNTDVNEQSNVVGQLTDSTTKENFTFDFEEGKEYIVYLRRDAANSYSDKTNPKVVDGKSYYTPNNMYVGGIVCTAVHTAPTETVATIGEDYTPVNRSISFGYSTSNVVYKDMKAKADAADGTWYTDGTFVPNGDATVTPAEGAVPVTTSNLRNYYYNNKGNAASTSLAGYQIVNKLLQDAQIANYDALGWRDLGHTKTLGAIRHDANQVLADVNKTNTYAALVKAPGTGTYKVAVKMRTSSPVSYKETVDGVEVTKYYNYAPLWQNIRIVKVEGDVAVENYADYYLQNKDSMPVAEYMPDWMQPVEKAGGGYDACTYDWINLTVKGTEKKVDFTIDLEAGADYIVYYELHENADFTKTGDGNNNYSGTTAYNWGIQFNCIDKATQKETYTTLSEALKTAQPGETVKLQQDALLNEVVITEGVTLDLNGHTLTTAAVGPTGKLVGNGVLKTYANTNVYAELMAENTLPLYDASVNGYKLYKYSYLNAQTEEVGNDTVKFWYQLLFEDVAAYDLIESGTSGLTMGVDLTADEVNVPCTFKNSKQTGEEIVNDANAWAAAYATFAKATLAKGKTPWLYVNVTNAAMADAISVAPVISAGNADYELAAINY